MAVQVNTLLKALRQIAAEPRPCSCQFQREQGHLAALGYIELGTGETGHRRLIVTQDGHDRLALEAAA
ncbi:hypothetical protein CcrColossus_gp409 [Caulobacter phage CcrColossus]|uniref:Uncharacterized protein n=1 Tax=Caulobacter phage CcrColossus TaxID=1211640 RepID=K4JSF2_9CAUD|nr:hypothetical protein CcrColossus_gp409 [Caulobacter phage CcrColossus]AFU88279.1 hypothetical protein CcrColossus_gp409 [Caulobacter phage CcrColossus]